MSIKSFYCSVLAVFISLFFNVNVALCRDFIDVKPTYWAYKEIQELENKEAIFGYTSYYFFPNNYITRAEFSSMVIRTLGLENNPVEKAYSFEDVGQNHWAYPYINLAVNYDILKVDDNGYFYPDGQITRSEMITFLVNILKTEDITKKEALKALNLNYSDYDSIPDWFKVTAGKAEVLNVIAKEPPREKYLDYDKYLTRAQAVVFVSNLKRELDKYKAEKIKEMTSPKKAEGVSLDNVFRDGDIVTIPAQTVLPVMVIGQLSSKNTLPGQMFQARFSDNIVDYESNLLLSKDTILIGKVLDTTKAKFLLKNGEILFELSAANNKNVVTRILGAAEYEAKRKIKGKNLVVKDGEVLYIKLFHPMKINIVTSEILD